MVFRSRFSRPKPNLSAAKKSSVTVKQSVSDVEDEKPQINQNSVPVPVPTVIVSTASPPSTSVQSNCEEQQCPQSLPTAERNLHSPLLSEAIPQAQISTAVISQAPPPKTTAPVEQLPQTYPAEPTTVTLLVTEHRSRTPLPCADKSDGERDESPLFVPKPSVNANPVVEIINLTPNYIPCPAPPKAKNKRRGPVAFHKTDLDDADSEDSDSVQSVLSEALRKRRNLEETLVGPETRRHSTEPRYRPNVRRLGEDNSGPMDKTSVTMRDLIYYTNRNKPPPVYRQEREMKQYGKSGCSWYQEENDKAPGSTKEEVIQVNPYAESTSSLAEDLGVGKEVSVKEVKVKEEKVKETEEEVKEESANDDRLKEEKVKKQSGGQAQFVMDADGNIVLNEESLVIRREYDEDYIDIKQDGVIGSATYSSFRKQKPRSKKWSLRETIRLYKALSTVGTDFSFMARLFKHRTREEIKKKFKREEKARPNFIDRVLSNRKHFDLSILDDTSDSDSSTSTNESKDATMIKDSLLEGNPRRFRRSKNYRSVKRYKKIDLTHEAVPGNPKWRVTKSMYRDAPIEPAAKRPRISNADASELISTAVENYQRNYPPSRPLSRASSTGGMEDVLTRLIDQKMKDLNERQSIRMSREISPPPPQPSVRNRALSLNDFCKHEANLKS